MSVSGQSKLDTNPVTLSSIQNEIEQVLEEKKVAHAAKPETTTTVKQTERYSAVNTPGK